MSAYDVIIIGSGAGGGTLARHLAPSGKSILILERGGWLPRELENWSAQAFLDGDGWAYTAGIIAVLVGAALVLFRFPAKDEEARLLAQFRAEDSEVSPAPDQQGSGAPEWQAGS
jgi:choline dehydrogenase-like flavoprotein